MALRLAFLWLLLSPAAVAEPTWPAAGTPLRDVAFDTPKPRRPWRIYLDAGHGAPHNTGNSSVICEDEQDYTLAVATAVARQLEATHRFRVKLSRTGVERPTYEDRLAAATAFGPAAIVSIHSDARGEAHVWEPRPGVSCLRNDADPGMGVLMSDEGPKHLVVARTRFARDVARELSAAGFVLYPGFDWMTLYARDSDPGVFIDRRPKRQRVYFLRKPRIPSLIVETHHALDLEENARWHEPRTIEVFGQALAVALDRALRGR
jgi:N-acetylmuramoyl-L-alanine amidase